jgi:hypothetical protein
MVRPRLSQFPTSKAWLGQFGASDQEAAVKLLDTIVLLNEEEVSTALRSQIYDLAKERKGKRQRLALYAEREFATNAIFNSVLAPDSTGRMRRRAVGRKVDAVKPVRGSPRVGSEGLVAFVISQAKEAWPEIIMNHPGPDLIRGKVQPAGSIVIVTDFIGSGTRVRTMLDAFWAVPTVRSWASRHLINFKVIAAAGTASGETSVRRHRAHPDVRIQYAIPTIVSAADWRNKWIDLIKGYGPDTGRGTGRSGFGGSAALVAFNYRMPNNTPALLHKTEGAWRALYDGPAPDDLRPAFGMKTVSEVAKTAAESTGVVLSPDLSPEDAAMVLVLTLIRGRWRHGAEIALAERTGLAVPDIWDVLKRALRRGYLTPQGRLTDSGQAVLSAGRQQERKKPEVPTRSEPYYPLQLRTPRGPSSTRRPLGRP